MLMARKYATAKDWLEALEAARRVRAEILRGPVTASTPRELAVVNRCIKDSLSALQVPMEFSA